MRVKIRAIDNSWTRYHCDKCDIDYDEGKRGKS